VRECVWPLELFVASRRVRPYARKPAVARRMVGVCAVSVNPTPIIASAMQQASKQADIDSYFFPEVSAGGFTRIDGSIQFYQRIHALIDSSTVILDFGAGRGAQRLNDTVAFRQALLNFKGKVREVIGVDVDPIVTQNDSLDRALVIKPDEAIPLPDRSIDLILSDFTFEHIAEPASIAAEFDRLLTEGGWICARTPNRWGYIAAANRLVPKMLRMRVLRFSQPERQEQDVFPALYRLNTPAALKRFFDPARFEHFVYAFDAEPAYHANSKLLYRVLLAIHALTPRRWKTMLFIFMRKRADLPAAGGA
jgi:SAM-dependent methyltransferase